VLALALAACVTLTACMGSAKENVRPQTTTRTDYLPESTAVPAVTAAPQMQATQAPVAFDWITGSGQIEGNVNSISEIADSRVVVTGTTALVGVRFAPEYRGEVTERIREMVAAEVMKADPSIRTVAVTAEEDDVEDVYEISDELRSGKPADSVGTEIEEIVRNATTLR
jgi:YhcN/YlaJ family sporulation lipoprotein